MRFMILMYPGAQAETGALPDEKALFAMMKYNEELTKAGVLLALEGLKPTAKGARIRFPGGKPVVSDGPFAEAKELVGGYWLIQVKSKEEAIQWASRCPGGEHEMLEVRQVFEMADFNVSPELAATADAVGKSLPTR